MLETVHVSIKHDFPLHGLSQQNYVCCDIQQTRFDTLCPVSKNERPSKAHLHKWTIWLFRGPLSTMNMNSLLTTDL